MLYLCSNYLMFFLLASFMLKQWVQSIHYSFENWPYEKLFFKDWFPNLNGLPTGIRTQPKSKFKNILQKQPVQVLVEEDTYVDTPALTKIFCRY